MAAIASFMPLFDDYIAVDWSANNSPKRGKDSIWIATASQSSQAAPQNLSTRHAAMEKITALCRAALSENRRALIGFDFAFGYPEGTAALWGQNSWAGIWALIERRITDSPKNVSNRYEVAEALNRLSRFEHGPFWGHPWQHSYDRLSPKKPKILPDNFTRFRRVERETRGAKSVWQLAYNGAVGSQTLLGVAALQRFRQNPELKDHIAVWPFETDFERDLTKPIILAEIYPSSHKGWQDMPHPTVDAQQVACVARDFMNWDAAGMLAGKLAPQDPLTHAQRRVVTREEGWIVGR